MQGSVCVAQAVCVRCLHRGGRPLDMQLSTCDSTGGCPLHAACGTAQAHRVEAPLGSSPATVGCLRLGTSASTSVEGATCASMAGKLLLYGTDAGRIAIWEMPTPGAGTIVAKQVAGWQVSCGAVCMAQLLVQAGGQLVCLVGFHSGRIMCFKL